MDQFQRALSDGDVRVLEAVHDGGSVALYGSRVQLHHLPERVECHVADVVVAVREESDPIQKKKKMSETIITK